MKKQKERRGGVLNDLQLYKSVIRKITQNLQNKDMKIFNTIIRKIEQHPVTVYVVITITDIIN